MKTKLVVCLCVCTILLSGCSLELSEEDSTMVAEYVANTILKYDSTYNDKLVAYEKKESSKEVVEEIEKEEIASNDTAQEHIGQEEGDNQEVNVDKEKIADLYKNEKIKLSYSSFEVMKQYPESSNDSYVLLPPESDMEYLLCKFNLTNLTNEKIKTDFTKTNGKFVLKVNGERNYVALLTFIENDIQYLQDELAPNETKEVILAFQLEKSIKIESLELNLIVNNITGTLVLK